MPVEPSGTAGFVLAGGLSSRMGTDKALLEIDGKALLQRIAAEVCSAAGSVVVIADPARYGHLGFTLVPDVEPGRGPLGGVVTALTSTAAVWNLVVAVDMPDISAPFLKWLMGEARTASPEPECVAPVGPTGPEPLCAVYHRRAAPKLAAALQRNLLTMRAVLQVLDTRFVFPPGPDCFRNINTPEDWAAHG